MLTTKTSVGITPEVNLRNPLHAGEKVHKLRRDHHQKSTGVSVTSPEVQNRGISGSTKRNYALQKLEKKSYLGEKTNVMTDSASRSE